MEVSDGWSPVFWDLKGSLLVKGLVVWDLNGSLLPAEGKWATSPEPPKHQSKPPKKGKLKVSGLSDITS